MASLVDEAFANVKFEPIWLDHDERPPNCAALSGKSETDLLIVGGGFTGLWSAVLAKEKDPDRDVMLIEAKSIANGATGRPGAIISTSVMHGLANAERLFPQDIEELERLGKENFDAVLDALERYEIDCDAEWGGEMTVALSEDALPLLDEEHRSHKRYGHDTVMLNGEKMRAQVNSPRFVGGLWSRNRSGTLHPAKLAWGLKRAAQKLGVRICENTPLEKMQRSGEGVAVSVPGGQITARRVLLATNAYAAGRKRIRTKVAAIRDRIIATEPLSDEQLASLGWANRQGIYDTRTQMNYMRLTKDNRVIFGGRLGYFFGNNTDPNFDKTSAPYRKLVARLYRTFPTLEGIRITHAWSGPIALTTRMAVHFQRYFGGSVVYVGGYSGFGVIATRFGARIGVGMLDGEDLPELKMEFARTEPNFIPPEPFRWIGAKLTIYAVDTHDEKGGWRKSWVRFVEKFGFPLTPW